MTEESVAQSGTGPDRPSSHNGTFVEDVSPSGVDAESKKTGARDQASSQSQSGAGASAIAHSSPKKRRKVNHGKSATPGNSGPRALAAPSWSRRVHVV